MIHLGIDYGLERVGLAVSNPEETLAFPLGVLALADFGARKALLDEIAAIARRENAGALVMGLALHEDGAESESSRRARNAAKRIARRADLPVHFMPELLSTWEALADLRASGVTGSKARKIVDQQAARLILQSYLDQPQKGAASCSP